MGGVGNSMLLRIDGELWNVADDQLPRDLRNYLVQTLPVIRTGQRTLYLSPAERAFTHHLECFCDLCSRRRGHRLQIYRD